MHPGETERTALMSSIEQFPSLGEWMGAAEEWRNWYYRCLLEPEAPAPGEDEFDAHRDRPGG